MKLSLKQVFTSLHHALKRWGLFMSSVVNFILLIPVYLLGVGVPALGMRYFSKKHFLDMHPPKKGDTYWQDHVVKKPSRDSSRRMF